MNVDTLNAAELRIAALSCKVVIMTRILNYSQDIIEKRVNISQSPLEMDELDPKKERRISCIYSFTFNGSRVPRNCSS